jgi:hypothetical protein
MKQINAMELMALFDETVRHALWQVARSKPGIDAVVVFENVDLCSSHLGERTAVIVGPACIFPSVEFCAGKHLNDLPSVRQYPQCWCPAADVQGLPEPSVVHYVVWAKPTRRGGEDWFYNGCLLRPGHEFSPRRECAGRCESRADAEKVLAVLSVRYPERRFNIV